MKCKACGGSGWDVVRGIDCISCDGKGEITQTNEEWFADLTAEEKAMAIVLCCPYEAD